MRTSFTSHVHRWPMEISPLGGVDHGRGGGRLPRVGSSRLPARWSRGRRGARGLHPLSSAEPSRKDDFCEAAASVTGRRSCRRRSVPPTASTRPSNSIFSSLPEAACVGAHARCSARRRCGLASRSPSPTSFTRTAPPVSRARGPGRFGASSRRRERAQVRLSSIVVVVADSRSCEASTSQLPSSAFPSAGRVRPAARPASRAVDLAAQGLTLLVSRAQRFVVGRPGSGLLDGCPKTHPPHTARSCQSRRRAPAVPSQDRARARTRPRRSRRGRTRPRARAPRPDQADHDPQVNVPGSEIGTTKFTICAARTP